MARILWSRGLLTAGRRSVLATLPLANSPRKWPVFKNGSQQCGLFPLPSLQTRNCANFPVFLRRIFL
jgi:hypothetical protein